MVQVFEETVEVCKQPLVKTCSNGTVGEEVCTTQYETNCETRYVIVFMAFSQLKNSMVWREKISIAANFFFFPSLVSEKGGRGGGVETIQICTIGFLITVISAAISVNYPR